MNFSSIRFFFYFLETYKFTYIFWLYRPCRTITYTCDIFTSFNQIFNCFFCEGYISPPQCLPLTTNDLNLDKISLFSCNIDFILMSFKFSAGVMAQIICSTRRPVEPFYWTSCRIFFYWTSSSRKIASTGRPVDSVG